MHVYTYVCTYIIYSYTGHSHRYIANYSTWIFKIAETDNLYVEDLCDAKPAYIYIYIAKC